MSIAIPFDIQKGLLKRDETLKQSIDNFIELLLTTPCHSCVADPHLGFVFNNLKFEIFNENDGVVYSSGGEEGTVEDSIYDKKISGSSKNINTFATELKRVINKYETRLTDVTVTMSYIREQKTIYINIKGIILENQADYKYQTTIRVWN
ncbi:MAG: hypothetical protein ACI30I_04370 [Parabacteroides sp.]